MNHATWNAILEISGPASRCDREELLSGLIRACDWAPVDDEGPHFFASTAKQLARGLLVDLPTCPRCAVLLDEALLSPRPR